MPKLERFDVLVVGAGPAGIAAAISASSKGARVGLVDENPLPGGQIYRASGGQANPAVVSQISELDRCGGTRFQGATVFDAPRMGVLLAFQNGTVLTLEYRKLILAVGARELFIPFPGWTLPNVMGVGGLQALVKSGLNVVGKKIVVAGSGPLLLAVGAYLVDHGADLMMIAEQAELSRLMSFSANLVRCPSKLTQGAGILVKAGRHFRSSAWVESANGVNQLEGVTIRVGSTTRHVECDYLACSFGFVPNLELPMLVGCSVEAGFVTVDEDQQTSVKDVYCVGEPTGIGGVDLSVVEGKIAGASATDQSEQARTFMAERSKWQSFAKGMDQTFSLRREIQELTTDETVVCRCEDVRMSQLVGWESARAAKLQTRCGMGPCQGRICGPATRFLLGWEHGSVQPPLSPVPLAGLESSSQADQNQTEDY